MQKEYRILLIDDDLDVCKLIERILTNAGGFNIKYINDPSDAIKVAERFSPDLILLDVVMPKMDGTEVAERLRERPALAGIPVAFLTVLADSAGSVSNGPHANDFIPKPFSPLQLLSKIKEILGIL